MYAELGRIARVAEPKLDWSGYPDSLPGCGSRSVEPGIAERLAAEAEGSPIRARRIEIGRNDDEFEFMFDQGLTDACRSCRRRPSGCCACSAARSATRRR